MTKPDLRASIALAANLPQLAYQLGLYRAALADDLDLAFLHRETPMPRAWRENSRNLPVVVALVDTVGKPAGPETWQATYDLLGWAEIAVLHQVGAAPGHYAHAVELAKTHRRVLLVEAPAETFDAWKGRMLQRMGLAVELMG